MTTDTSFFDFIINASFIVKCVILILVFASISSWTMIVERWKFYKNQWEETAQFETRFWSGIAINDLYNSVKNEPTEMSGLPKVFSAGFETFSK